MFAALIQTLTDIKAAIAAKDYKSAWQKEIDLQQQVLNILYGPPVMGATPDDHAALEAAVNECVAACHAANAPKAGEVGKIGDGTILKLLIQLLPYILPLIPK